MMAGFDQIPQLIELLALGTGCVLQAMSGKQLGAPIEYLVIDQIVFEAAESRTIAAVQVPGLKPVA